MWGSVGPACVSLSAGGALVRWRLQQDTATQVFPRVDTGCDVMLVSGVNVFKYYLSIKHYLTDGVTGTDAVSTSPSVPTEHWTLSFPSHHPLCLVNVWCDINRRKHRRQHDKPALHIKHIISLEGVGLPQHTSLPVCGAWIKQQMMKYWLKHSEELQREKLLHYICVLFQNSNVNLKASWVCFMEIK